MRSGPASRHVLVAALALMLGACDDGGSAEPTSTPAPREQSCERVDELLDAAWACRADEACPCGAHCTLGRCEADCRVDADCAAGTLCDRFGRCAAEDALAPVPASGDAQRLTPPAVGLSFGEEGAIRTLRLPRAGGVTGPVRIEAPPSLLVRCASDGDFQQSCTLTPEGETVEVDVRPAGALPASADAWAELQIFSGAQRLTVPARLAGPRAALPDRPTGAYRGCLAPIEAGSAARSEVEELPASLSGLCLPATVTVFPGTDGLYPVRLQDELGALFGPDGQVGELRYDAATGFALRLPAFPYLVAGEGARALEAFVDDVEAPAAWEGASLSIPLTTTFQGLTNAMHAPTLGWRLQVTQAAELTGDEVAPTLPAAFVPTLAPTRALTPFPAEEAVLSRLEPALAGLDERARAEALFCTLEGAAAPTALGASVLQLAGVPAASGDLACSGGEAARTFGLLGSNLLAVNENVKDCLADLGRLDEGPEAALTSDGCVDATRVAAALGDALQLDRARGLGEGRTTDETASALGHRLLQQWLALHTFLSREAMQLQQLNDILDPAGRVTQEFGVASAVSAGLHGWDLLLHPRVAVPLAVAPPALLQAPDYRARLFPAESFPLHRSHDQVVGLPVAMIDTANGQLEVLARLAEEATSLRADRGEVEALVAEALPRLVLATALAHQLHDRALQSATPPWEQEWQDARAQLGGSLAGLHGAIATLREGRNVLGIEEGDLPLYRVGDQATTRQRFSALTDFLVGATDDGVAQYTVDRADGALEAARGAWRANVERDLDLQLEGFARERRLEALRADYGGTAADMCGDLPWETNEVLDHWSEVDVERCWVNDACRLTDAQAAAGASAAELGYQLCVMNRLRDAIGPGLSTGSRSLDAFVDGLDPLFGCPSCAFPLRVQAVSGSTVTLAITNRGGARVEVELGQLRGAAVRIDEVAQAERARELVQACAAGREATLQARPRGAPGACSFADDCPIGHGCTEGACVVELSPGRTNDPSCYQGSIGDQALAVRAASLEVSASRAAITEYADRYGIALQSCTILAQSNGREQGLVAITNGVLTVLNVIKTAASITAAIADAVSQSTGIDTAATAGAKAGAEAVKATANTVALVAEGAATELERYRDMAKDMMQDWEDETRCFNDASMELVGLDAERLRLQQASNNLVREWLAFETLKGNLAWLLETGHGALLREERRTLTPIASDFWISEEVQLYRRYLRQARRTAYLAVLAAEYEYQFSSNARASVLAARTPAELQAVIDGLRAQTLTGTVAGAAPSDKLYVISLRDQLLQLADRSGDPAGFQGLSPVERFRLLLTDPANAVHAADGRWLGQEVPFSIAPLATLGLGDPQGIPLLSGMDCAERLWSVNASLLGEGLYVGSDTTFAPIVLRKRNTFFSQWCDAAVHPEGRFQAASTRPGKNLFLDPLDPIRSNTPATPAPDGAGVDPARAFTDARISAYFNVPQAALEDEAYFNGDSQELAARGLYGEYALFFPAQLLAVDGGDGLDLGHVDDILLRLDYVSVAARDGGQP